MDKLIVILGPTASGKSDLAVRLARKYGGEIISADSRQVYKGLNVGSGKITKNKMKGIPHYLLDVADPKRKFTVAHFQKLALKAIRKIKGKNKIPFLVGGTGFYIQSVVNGIKIPKIPPDWKLRKNLANKQTKDLYKMLLKLDLKRTKNIDSKNPRRLIRAIEIALATKKPIPEVKKQRQFNVLQIGIKKRPDELKKAIKKRLLKRLKQGLVREAEKLHRNRIPWKRLEELGLEYRYVAQYLQDKIDYKEMVWKLETEIRRFAKRQMTWFKRDKRINWVSNPKEAERLVKVFL